MKTTKELPQPVFTVDGDYFKLVKDFKIMGITIPKGEKSDGLTLKVRLLNLVVYRYQPSLARFFFLHDYLCRLGQYKKADDLGEKVLFENGKTFRKIAMMKLIRLYHKIKYK